MIRTIAIQGFKKFSSETFNLAPLTVLAGMNGAGKTSFIHALLLMREASRHESQIVELNGPYELELGTFGDIQNWDGQTGIRFELGYDDQPLSVWELHEDNPESLYAHVIERPRIPPIPFGGTGRSFEYLSAERFGPRTALDSSALPPQLLEVGCRGQFTAQVLDTLDNLAVDEARQSPNRNADVAPLLKFEVESWLSEIVRPIQIDTESLTTKTSTALKFRTPEGEWVRATNMGFGVTYALPIIVAGLLIETGGLLIVENPEAHLHPAGQSKMGRFLAHIAAAGVQVIVETHSDHVLNGIRRTIGESNKPLPENAITYFFGDGDASPIPLRFTARGGIEDWPLGFFDQFQLDVAALTRIRRQR